jgi:hypothetical protein
LINVTTLPSRETRISFLLSCEFLSGFASAC